jgi:beta-galactosidase
VSRVTPHSVAARPVAALRDVLDRLGPEPVRRPTPEPMEKLGFTHGLVHYRHRVDGPSGPAELRVDGVRDLAQVFADGRLLGTLERDRPDTTLPVDVPDAGLELDILVEPLGRVNYGPLLADRKGLIGGVRLDHQFLHGWDIRVLTLDDLAGLDSVPVEAGVEAAEGPRFHRATVTLERAGDAFVAVPEAERCLVWVNGFLLGRLWNRGPQRTLYAPGPLWQSGDNDVVVLDLVPGPNPLPALTVEIRDEPDLGPVAPTPIVD